ncbi:MAG: lysophospholipid acyltransferase family protein [Myxococcales bacterium]|nr:lysophospholipid acyltransferase family protein [Myxococcales bacterium]
MRLLLWTLRVRVVGSLPAGPSVFAFWHGKQLGLLRVPRPRPTQVLVSWSKDGELQSAAMQSFGLTVVRGSSSKGGGAALRQLVRRLPEQDVALAVDGPRGPRRCAKPGAVLASRLAGAPLVPLGIAFGRSFVFRRAWDRFELPLPFSRVCVVIGDASEPSSADRLTEDLDCAERQAERALRAWSEGSKGPSDVPHPLLMRGP